MQIELFTTGGTFDKIYFDALSEFTIGEPQAPGLLMQGNISCELTVTELLRKDSLEMTNADRQLIAARVAASSADNIIIVHGTDTMADTGRALPANDKTVVLVGAMQPAAMRDSDAPFNLGFALAAVQLAAPGVYIAMNGELLPASTAVKDHHAKRFIAG